MTHIDACNVLSALFASLDTVSGHNFYCLGLGLRFEVCLSLNLVLVLIVLLFLETETVQDT